MEIGKSLGVLMIWLLSKFKLGLLSLRSTDQRQEVALNAKTKRAEKIHLI
jgi:hypothetical protein